jgi:hypothetical protein
LDGAGYLALPAKNTIDAVELLRLSNREFHLLVVNHSLAGAADLIALMRRSNRSLKVIAVSDLGEPPGGVPPGVDLIESRPAVPDKASALKWLASIRTLIGSNQPTGKAGGSNV